MRCVMSVATQKYGGHITHVIVLDDTVLDASLMKMIRTVNKHVQFMRVDTSRHVSKFQPFYSVSRIGFLRNTAISKCETDLVAFLDDDNQYRPDHLESLVNLISANRNTSFTYSWRYLWHPDGRPFFEHDYPWTPHVRLAFDQAQLRAHLFAYLVAQGVRCQEDNIQRDVVVAPDGHLICTVDTSEILVKRQILAKQGFVTQFSFRELVGDFSDDYAIVKLWHEMGCISACSRRATVDYFLSGTSNRR